MPSRRLNLPQGGHLQLPLLVPSFSSKGFEWREASGPLGRKRALSDKEQARLPTEARRPLDGSSEVAYYLDVVGDDLNETMLVSSYDLYYKHLPQTAPFFENFRATVYSNPVLLFIDSGGYETGSAFEGGETHRGSVDPKLWNAEMHAALLDRVDEDVQAVVVNADVYGGFEAQVEAAAGFFADRNSSRNASKFVTDFLIKPEERGDLLDLSRLSDKDLSRLNAFDVIGVTEKELGDSMQQRILVLGQFCQALNRLGVDKPVHVFGSLDPLFSPLYFLAGAQIFDGLTWLRYTYLDGLSVYMEAQSVLSGNTHWTGAQRGASSHRHNLAELQQLTRAMRRYAKERDLTVLPHHHEVLAKVRGDLLTGLGGN